MGAGPHRGLRRVPRARGTSNADCFRLPAYLKERRASALWSANKAWLDHPIDTPAAVRRSALFPAFEADAMTAAIEHEPLGQDGITDLLLLNYKGADFVGHRYGPDSNELRLTLGEMDRHLGAHHPGSSRPRSGRTILLAVTADHGMPSAPPERRHRARSWSICCTRNSIRRRSSWSPHTNRKTRRSSSTRTGYRSSVSRWATWLVSSRCNHSFSRHSLTMKSGAQSRIDDCDARRIASAVQSLPESSLQRISSVTTGVFFVNLAVLRQ